MFYRAKIFIPFLFVAAVVFAIVSLSRLSPTRALLAADPMSTLPKIFLWAWERPENCDFLETSAGALSHRATTLI